MSESPLAQSVGSLKFAVLCLAVLATFFCATPAHAKTPWQDVKVSLSIEIGDGLEDFADADKVIEKARTVTYRARVENTGEAPQYGLSFFMNSPDYMNYVPESATLKDGLFGSKVALPDLPMGDLGMASPFEAGYGIDELAPGQVVFFDSRHKVFETMNDDETYTVAWAGVTDRYGSIPLMSNLVENQIFGEPKVALRIVIEANPPAGTPVAPGFQIRYATIIQNVGGKDATGVILTSKSPKLTQCSGVCDGSYPIGDLASGQTGPSFDTLATVNPDLGDATQIVHEGSTLNATGLAPIVSAPIFHPLEGSFPTSSGLFFVDIVQKPGRILNSADRFPNPDANRARADRADITETKYTLNYEGMKKPFTYPGINSSGSYTIAPKPGCSRSYAHSPNATTIAYNSSGGGDDYGNLTLSSSPIIFSVATTLPPQAPKLIPIVNEKTYSFGNTTSEVNYYMQNGFTHLVSKKLTESRAVENGSGGVVTTKLVSAVSEDRWIYTQTSVYNCPYSFKCGKKTCSSTVPIPLFQWQKSSVSVPLDDGDQTGIDVYTSTAWLKTEKGHIGTNDQLTNGETPANRVNLGEPGFTNFLTPSGLYTPPGETNADLMIFGTNGTDKFTSASGDRWKVTGTAFPFPYQGEAYDRSVNPRDYTEDLLIRQKYGEVKKNVLPSTLSGTVALGDDVVWWNTNGIVIGNGVADVTFEGGQARIYTEGDVTIKSNIKYALSKGKSANAIPSVRIDARNIFVDGGVTDLNVYLSARDSFHSGKSKSQLRILGDVIARQAYWEREPLLEKNPTEFNKPSEHLIEDLRKYVIPPLGDAELPDDRTVWRQVNPATGQVLDSY